MEFHLEMFGDEAIRRMFAELPERARARVLKPLLAQAADLFDAAVTAEAPRESGLLATALGRTAVKTYANGRILFAAVGPRRGFGRVVGVNRKGQVRRLRGRRAREADVDRVFRNPTKYAHILHGGRKAIETKDAKVLYSAMSDTFFGRRAKAVDPDPFMERGFEAAQGPAVELFRVTGANRIIDEARALCR